MPAGADEGVGVAEVDALAVELVLNAEFFGSGITRGGKHLEPDGVTIIVGILIACGEIAKNPVANLMSCAHYRAALRHLQAALVLVRDVTVVVQHALRLI